MSNSFQFKGNVEENLIPRDELATQPSSIKKKQKKKSSCVSRDDLEALTKLCAVVPLMEVAANENEAPGVIGRLTKTLGWMQWHVNLSRHRAAKDFRKKAEVGRTLKWSVGVGGCRRSSACGGHSRLSHASANL